MSAPITDFWSIVTDYLAAAHEVATAQNLINLTRRYFPEENATEDAFFPGSGGSGQLIDSLQDNSAFTFTWIDAEYHWVARDRDGAEVHYTEGDLRLVK